MLRVALRTNLWSAVGFGAIAAFYAAFLVGSYTSISGDRAAAARDLTAIAPGFSFILALPTRLDTSAGYLAWFGYGQLVAIFAFWGTSAGTFAARGAEERALTDAWLSAGVSRRRVLLSHVAAFGLAALAALALGAAAALVVSDLTGEPMSATGLALQSFGVLGIALTFDGLGLVVGQLATTRRSALGAAALVLVVLFLLNGFSRQWDVLATARWISPFAYYDRVHGLVPDLSFGGGFLAALIATSAAAILLALAMFDRRDIGATLGRSGAAGPPRRVPSTNPLLRRAVLGMIWDQRVGLAIWCVACLWQSFFVTRLATPFLRALAQADPGDASGAQLRVVTGAGHGAPFEGFVGFEWFGTLACAAAAVYAVARVARWSADDGEGRLEMLLAAPVSRTRVVLERVASLGIGAVAIAIAGLAGVTVGTVTYGATLDAARLIIATAMLVPVATVFGGVGAAVSAWRPRVAVVALSALALVSFFIPFAAPTVRGAPDWFNDLSVFSIYGTPLSDGFVAWRFGVLVAVSAAGFALGIVAMRRRDIGR